MANYLSRVVVRNGWDPEKYRMIALLACLLTIGLVSGCRALPASSIYENQEQSISLMRPGNWKVAYYKRSGQIILEAKAGIRMKVSARVEVFGNSGIPIRPEDSVEAVHADIQRMRILYDLDSVSIIQAPMRTRAEGREVVTAIIGLPVAELPDDAVINQVGGHEPGVMQTVDIRIITDSDGCSVMVYLYKGNSEALNAEAEDIVESIRFTCPAK